MSMSGYTKLFSSILASTIWREDNITRIVWITLLAMSDKNGVAEGSIPGLADFARVSVDECRSALRKLSAPDEDSRSKEVEGRRIEAIDGGWQIVNHAKYRAKMSADERREYLRIKQAEYRKRKQSSTPVDNVSDTSTLYTHTEAEAKANTDPKAKEQKQQSAAPLITSPKAYAKRQEQCAFVGSRLEVPHVLHGELRKLLGGDDPESKLMGWYLALNDEIEISGEPITPDVFKWLKARFTARQKGTKRVKPLSDYERDSLARQDAAIQQQIETRRRRLEMEAQGKTADEIEAIFDAEFTARRPQ